MDHFININVTDLAAARSVSLLNPTTPRPFPVMGYGDNIVERFFFHSDGTITSWSGDATNGLRVTLGDVARGPFGGSYTLTCGQTTAAIDYDEDASVIETVLNALSTVSGEGGVVVDGEAPNFFVTWLTTGAKTALTASAEDLIPVSGIQVTTLQTGTGSVTQRAALTLRRSAIYSTTTWTPITSPYAGWSGTVSTNTEGALSLLINEGERVGDFVQVVTVITVERIQADGTYETVYQAPFTLRAKNVDLGATGSPAFSSYITNTQFLILGVQNRSTITGLAAVASDATKLGGLPTANAAFVAGTTMVLNFAVTINDGAGTHAGIMTLIYQLRAGTTATAWPYVGRPFDYNASTNAVVWALIGSFLDGLPAAYNSDTGKFHYLTAAGSANAVVVSLDQTGTAAPA